MNENLFPRKYVVLSYTCTQDGPLSLALPAGQLVAITIRDNGHTAPT